MKFFGVLWRCRLIVLLMDLVFILGRGDLNIFILFSSLGEIRERFIEWFVLELEGSWILLIVMVLNLGWIFWIMIFCSFLLFWLIDILGKWVIVFVVLILGNFCIWFVVIIFVMDLEFSCWFMVLVWFSNWVVIIIFLFSIEVGDKEIFIVDCFFVDIFIVIFCIL